MVIISALVTLLAVFLVDNQVNGAVAIGSSLNYLPETSRNNAEDHTSCCVIPTCDEYGKCYETLSCGYICSQGRYRPANFGVTRGYKLREYYSKYECRFGECKEYKFLCKHCPNPNTSDFSFYTVRDDCRNCYDRPYY